MQAVADELNKQMGAKPIASANANEDTDTSNPDKEKDDKEPKECPPCETISGRKIKVGTIGYLPLDELPDHVMQHGRYGSHHNYFLCNQVPKTCKCFWNKQRDVLKPHELPSDAIPYEPLK